MEFPDNDRQVDVPVAPGNSEACVRWGRHHHTFELRSADPRVIARASVVFRPWMPVRPDAAAARTWTVGADGDSGPWTVQAGAGGPAMVQSTPEGAVRLVESLAVRVLYEGRDFVVVHGALVSRGGRGLLVCGPAGAGKSTLACALWQRGFQLHGDDAATLDLEGRQAQAAPRRVALRASSLSILGDGLAAQLETAPASEPTAEGLMFHVVARDEIPPGPVRLAACIFLARRGAGPARDLLTPLVAAHAALALLPYLNAASRLDETVMGRIASFAADVPAFDLARAPLDEMATAVTGLTDEAPA
jgi:hypothetical protein